MQDRERQSSMYVCNRERSLVKSWTDVCVLVPYRTERDSRRCMVKSWTDVCVLVVQFMVTSLTDVCVLVACTEPRVTGLRETVVDVW